MGFRNWDDIIRRLGAMAPNDPLYLKKLEDISKRQGAAEDLARGSGMALRARNAQRGFLDELADAELPEPRRYSPRDLARAAADDRKRDMQYGPFPAGAPGVWWDIKRAAERSIDEAAAAAQQAQRFQPINRAQLTNDAANAALALGGGSLAAAMAIEAMRSSDPASEQQRAQSGLAASLPPAEPADTTAEPLTPGQAAASLMVSGGTAPPTEEETARSGLAANLPPVKQQPAALPQQSENLSASATQLASDPPLAAKPREQGPFLLSEEEQEKENARQLAAMSASAAAQRSAEPDAQDFAYTAPQPQPQPQQDIPAQYQTPEPAVANNLEERDNRYWNNPGVKERKIARMAKAAGLTMEEARALVDQGGVRADGMTDDAFNLTAAGRAEEFRGLRDAVTNRRNADERSRMDRYKAQAMLAGANPNKNMVNALSMLAPDDQQAALQFMLGGRRGATPLDVQQQRAVVDQRRQLIEAENAGRLEQIQAQVAADRDLWDKRLAQSGQQLETDRALRLKEEEAKSARHLAEINANLERTRLENQSRIDAALASIQGAAANTKMEADARKYQADREAEVLLGKNNNPVQMQQVMAALANQNAERRARLLEQASSEANKYAYDTGSYFARALTPGWDSALVTKDEEDKLRSYLRAYDPQATPQEIEQVLTAALRNKKREK